MAEARMLDATMQKLAMAAFQVEVARRTRQKQHLWLVLIAYYATPEDHEMRVSPDNYAYSPPPGCFICEQDYTPELAAEPCPGDPEGREL